MKEHVPKPYKLTSKLICDQTNKEYYIFHYGNLKFYARMGNIVTKVRKIVSFDQSPWLEKYFDYKSKKREQADSDFKKDSHEGLSNSFFGKRMEHVRNRIKLQFVKNTNEEKVLRYQSRFNFDGIHKSYLDYDSFTFEKNVIKMAKPTYLGFVVLERSKFLLNDTYYGKLQKYFGQDGIPLHYQNTDSMVSRYA